MKVSIPCLALACVFSVSLAPAEEAAAPPAAATCREDSDCKLIYSSCACDAVSSHDARDHLVNEHGIDCAQNVCRSQHARAVCKAGVCARDPVRWDLSPRK